MTYTETERAQNAADRRERRERLRLQVVDFKIPTGATHPITGTKVVRVEDTSSISQRLRHSLCVCGDHIADRDFTEVPLGTITAPRHVECVR